MLISDGAIAPISLADVSPQYAYANYSPTAGLGLTDSFAAYGAIYRRQLWVAVMVNKIAKGTARLPLKTYQRGSAGRDSAADSPLGRLMAQPNETHDPFFFWLWTVSTFEVYGEAMWLKIRPRPTAPPMELWPLHPSNVVTHRNTSDDEAEDPRLVAGDVSYWYMRGGATVPIVKYPAADIVHFKSYNPDNQIRGMSPLEPLRQTLVNEDAARRATASFWLRGARPGFALSTDKTLSEPAAHRLAASFDRITGGADRTGATIVLEEGMTPTKLDLTAEEAQYIESRKLNREEVCAAYDVPPPVVHILDHATFSNITEQMRSMYRDTMAPRLGLFESALHTQLTPDFGDDSLYCEFLMDEVLRGDFEARMAAYATGITHAILMPGEAREMENHRDAGPDSHRLYIQSATVPLGTAAGANPTGQEVEIKPQAIKALSAGVVRTVMGRLSRVGSLAEVDPDALTIGLNGDAKAVLSILDASVMADESPTQFRDRLRAATEEVPA